MMLFSPSLLHRLGQASKGKNLPFHIIKNQYPLRRLHSRNINFTKIRTRPRLLLGSACLLSSFIYYERSHNSTPILLDTSIHKLVPVKDSETFEQGLYDASEKELSARRVSYRNEKLQNRNLLQKVLYWLIFKFEDILLDPIIITSRFIEITCIFLPVFICYPISWFGKKDKDHHNVRSGTFLWCRFLRKAIELAGPSFIKLGQWAASRTDIFSKEFCDELSVLHSNARAHSLKNTKKIISESFEGMPFDEIFEEFNETPVGVGAIAQVYVAKLSESVIRKMRGNDLTNEYDLGSKTNTDFFSNLIVTESRTSFSSAQEVAIKVLHPNVRTKVERDLKIISFIAQCINLIPTMEWLSLPDEVEQFSILMRLQLDLRIEGLNLAKFRHNFKDRLDIKFPKPYLNYSTRSILVEEYIHGIPLSRLLALKQNFGKNLSKEVSDKGIDSFLKMLILDNFVHADLHPGNIIVRFYRNEMFRHEREYKILKTSNEQETNRITNELLELGDNDSLWCKKLSQLYAEGYHAEVCYLDVGIVTELNKSDRINFIDLFRSLSEFDGYRAGELMAERSRTPETVQNKEIFALKVEKLVNKMKARTFTLGNISIGDLLDQVLSMVRVHHVRMEGDFVTVIVAILLLEGMGRQLDPDLDLFASSLPVLRRLGISKEGREILKDEDSLNMIKVWLALEIRQFISVSIQDIHAMVKSDILSPNV